MSRWCKVMAVVACAVALGCTGDTVDTASFVGIQGATDLVLVNDLAFVTATDTNELRALNLAPAEGKIVDWVRAPNPLHPLSIPVADRPIELEGDVVWTGEGQQGSGSYVYARAASGREVSIVDANRDFLKEVAVINTLGSRNAADVAEEITALAARGGADGSTLYLATYDGTRSRIWAVQLPKSGSPQKDYPTTLNADEATQVGADEPCGAILSMLVLPGNQLAYSVRRTSSLGVTCGPTTAPEIATLRAETSVMIDTESGARTVLAFGRPMRRLFTNPRYENRPEANRIYGIVDEGSCGLADRCRGILAVVGPGFAKDPVKATPADATQPCGEAIGAIACDAVGLPMAPIQSANALVMAATVGKVSNLAGVPQDSKAPSRLTGISTLSNGRLQLWDAENLIDYDLFESGDADTKGLAESIYMTDAAGNPAQYVKGLVDRDPESGDIQVTLANGAARDETIRVRHGGNLPDFTGQPAPAGDTLTPAVTPVGEVEVGDVVTATGACEVTSTTVAAVTATELTFAEPLATGPGCTFSIRPPEMDGRSDWIVFGTRSGFLGRFTAPAAEGDVESHDFPVELAQRRALYFRHFPGTNGSAPLITFSFQGTADPLPIGTTYVITSRSNFRRAEVTLSQARAEQFLFNGSRTIGLVRVAGAAAFRTGTTELLVSYPSDNALMRVDAVNLNPQAELTEFTVFR